MLTASPLLTILLVVALGAAVGVIPFGPLRFGAAGALFVGLALGALEPSLGEGLGIVSSLGLALFVYTVGIAAGETFFADLRQQIPVMGLGVGVIVVVTVLAVLVGAALGLGPPLVAGVLAGALTSTPALAAATAATGPDAAIGYSLGYPVGVVLSIIAVGLVVQRRWPGANDSAPPSAEGLVAESVHVERATLLRAVPGWSDETIKMSYLIRSGATRVLAPGEDLHPGDQVLVIGAPDAVNDAVLFLGHRMERELTSDRDAVDFKRLVVSSPAIAGRTVAQLNLPSRYGGVLTRVRRGDNDLLARDDLVLQLGDRVLAVAPQSELAALTTYLGDSERRVSEVDALALGLGMVVGLLLGAVTIPIPGGVAFSLGPAAGPLVAGMVLGAVHRSGPLIWNIPLSVNLTIRQLGLLLFLATVGLASGPLFAEQAFTPTGLRAGALSVVVVGVSAIAFLGGARLLGLSAQRGAGGFAGYVGQPAVLAFATQRVSDERIDAGYAALFALCIIAKIVAVQVIGAVG
ncbi:aspartate:alanine exchanger family transporter [Tessaracoccus antarcticus]|uniref:Transporter n=1 Tax=Tessaracoccus antarcticus TaxID=2479848 RepID=A0A3M0G264_9ACTN|nr:TrkA C-terminal domain-containing protein [Tessaracoccus antarcticus]RMB59024.1 transporter [Tessaracoccus antarcticus]